MAEEYLTEDADVVLVAYGASSRVARSAVNKAREKGIKAGLVRPITLWPFPVEALNRAAFHANNFLVVEDVYKRQAMNSLLVGLPRGLWMV